VRSAVAASTLTPGLRRTTVCSQPTRYCSLHFTRGPNSANMSAPPAVSGTNADTDCSDSPLKPGGVTPMMV